MFFPQRGGNFWSMRAKPGPDAAGMYARKRPAGKNSGGSAQAGGSVREISA